MICLDKKSYFYLSNLQLELALVQNYFFLFRMTHYSNYCILVPGDTLQLIYICEELLFIFKPYFRLREICFYFVFPTYVNVYTKIGALYSYRAYSTASIFSFTRKVGPDADHHPNSPPRSHYQATNHNNTQ